MSFWAKSFVFDNVPSETFGLFIISEGAAGVLQNTGSSSVNLYTQEIYRRPKPYLFGTQQTPTLSFDLIFASLTPLSAYEQQAVQKWLFGYNTYKTLQIMQCDMDDIYFNCILNEPTVTTVGNFAYEIKCTVICDAPWAWEYPKTQTFGPFNVEGTFNFDNTSDDNYYMFPTMTVTLSDHSNSFQIINTTDNSSTCTFTGLSPSEVLTINSDKYIISSSTGLLRVANMSGILPRMVPGYNNFQVNGTINSIVISYQNARKVSA